MNREELLAAIRKIVGNKRFYFSEAYVKKCGGTPTIGTYMRRYTSVTKKYIYIHCRVVYTNDLENKEYGALFLKYSLLRQMQYQNVDKVALEDIFTKDLQKIYNDLIFYLWWEKNVHLQRVENEYNECRKYVDIYDKIEISNEDMRKLENR